MSRDSIVKWAQLLEKASFFVLFIAVPLILTPVNFELFEYNKMMLTYGLTVVILASWLFKSLAEGKFKVARTPLDIPILLFLGSQILATIFSIDPHVSWMGYYSRFNGGLWSTISYVILYYAFVSNISSLIVLLNLLKVTLVAAIVVAFYGGLEHFGIDKNLWVQDVQSRVFSTLGQPNWLAAYLVALIALPVAIFIDKWMGIKKFAFSSIFSIYHLAFIILFFIVLLWTRSRSGLLGFLAADAVFWGFSYFISKRLKSGLKERRSLLTSFVVCNLAFLLIVFLNGSYVEKIDKYFTLAGWQNLLSKKSAVQVEAPVATPSGTLLEYGGTESSTIRKYVWEAAVTAWNSSTKTRLIGTGTETFAFAFFQFKPKAHNLTSEWDFLYNKAHNEYLNYLATTGAIGLGTYLILIVTFIIWFVKVVLRSAFIVHGKDNVAKNSLNPFAMNERITLSLALFAGWISILVTNFFGFSVVIIQIFFFLFPAFIFALNGLRSWREFNFTWGGRRLKLSYLFVVVVALYILLTLAKFWYADTLYASGYRFDRAGSYGSSEPLLARASVLNNNEPIYHDELASSLAGLAVELAGAKESSQAADLMKQSFAESDKALSISPKNVNFWKTRTKIFYSFSDYLPEMNTEAINALLRAAKLSPLDPKIYYNLAILYGRENNDDKAISLLKQTIDLKPNYRDAYYALYVFYNDLKKTDLARQALEDYLTKVDPNDKDFQARLGR